MIKKLSILLATLLTAGIANAKISPVYEVLRIIDEATEAVAELDGEDQEELEIAKVELVTSGESAAHIASATRVIVTTEKKSCNVRIIRKNPPPGLIGASLLSATVSAKSCSEVMTTEVVKTMKYEKIAPKLSKAASEGKLISGLEVTSTKAGKAKLKLVYAK